MDHLLPQSPDTLVLVLPRLARGCCHARFACKRAFLAYTRHFDFSSTLSGATRGRHGQTGVPGTRPFDFSWCRQRESGASSEFDDMGSSADGHRNLAAAESAGVLEHAAAHGWCGWFACMRLHHRGRRTMATRQPNPTEVAGPRRR